MSSQEHISETKVHYLIKRKLGISREILVAHWLISHMPKIMQAYAAGAGPDIRRYRVSLFEEPGSTANSTIFDGVAMLTAGRQPKIPNEPFGTDPVDDFQKVVEPYWPWHTIEQLIVEPQVEPVLNTDPLPRIESNSIYVYQFLEANDLRTPENRSVYWREHRGPRVRDHINACGATSYTVSISDNTTDNPYTAIEEYRFNDLTQWEKFHDMHEDYSDPQTRTVATAVSTSQFIGV